MIKKLFFKIIYWPFLFPIIYQIKIPLRNWGSINLLDLLLFFSIGMGFFFIFQEKKWADFKINLQKNALIKKIGLFLLFGFLALIFNLQSDWLRTLGILKSFFILPILWGILINYWLKKKRIQLWNFFYYYLFYSLFLGFLTILFKVSQLTTFDNRVRLFFDSPNQLAIALTLGIISGVIIIIHKADKKIIFLLPFLLIALFLTKSAGAISALGIVFFLTTLKEKFSISKKLLLNTVLVVSIFSLLIVMSSSFWLQKTKYDPFLNKNSSDSRIVISLVTEKIIRNHFWSGIGLSNFQNQYLRQQPYFPPYPQWAVPHSHNLFSQIWVAFGFWGLLFWIIFLKQKTKSCKKNLFVKISFYFLFYFLIHGLIDVPIWNNDQALFFWFIVLF